MRRSLPVGLLSAGLLVVAAVPASAEGAERAGWWNRLAAGPLVAPAPGTEPGELRIAGGGPEVTAFAAVLLRAGTSTEGTLDLEVRPDSVIGTVAVVACPTADEAWPEGDNQAFDKAPVYDCEAGRADGVLSEDGTTLTFELDDSTQLVPGTWSLALVPAPDGGAPFSVDLAPVGPDALTPAPAASGDEGGESSDSPPAFDPFAAGGAGSGNAPPPALTGGFDAPVPDPGPGLGAADAPILAGADVPLPGEQPAPAVASDAAPTLDLVPTAPVGRTALASHEGFTGPRLLALLVLAGGSAAVGYAAGQQRTGPRLIGGRRRSAVPAGAPVPEDETSPAERPRGIGRFARERDGAPRRLR